MKKTLIAGSILTGLGAVGWALILTPMTVANVSKIDDSVFIDAQDHSVDKMEIAPRHEMIREVKRRHSQENHKIAVSMQAPVVLLEANIQAPILPNHVVEDFQKSKENTVMLVAKDPVSTFSIDSDDGSYRLFKRSIMNGLQFNRDLIRTEEFINAFDYNYEKPESKAVPFTTTTEIVDSPWSDNKILKIGIQGYEESLDSMAPVNLVFLVDTSGSMRREMSKIKFGLKALSGKLRPTDSISIVTYAGSTRVLLEATQVKDISVIDAGIESLSSNGGTNGEAGIHLAYKQAEKGFIEGGVNRILLVSDGDLNVGLNDTHGLKQLITEKRKSGITFSTIGISDDNNYRDGLMESMANVGNGNYTFIGDINDAREVFADRFVSTLVNIAKDVKSQIEFNPDMVSEYRLIGYENRALQRQDFANDKVDAGELPSGLSTTILYEVTLKNEEGLYGDLRYGAKKSSSNKDNAVPLSNELAFLKIRYKEPGGDESHLLQFPITQEMYTESPSVDTTFALSVAGFAQSYKQSNFIEPSYTTEKIIETLQGLTLSHSQNDFLRLIRTENALEDKPNRPRHHQDSEFVDSISFK